MKAFFVTDRLAFGSAIKSWRHVERLRAQGITHVINLRRSQNQKIRQFASLWLRFKDDKKPRPAWFYSRALRFYQRAMQRPNAKLLVMCHHGVCRSPSLAYFFLRASGASPQKAETFVRKARPSAMIVRAYRKSCEAYLRRRER